MTENTPEFIHQDRVWSDARWTARVIKNEDDDGWAVAMMLHGESEPALVGPWTMGRDKKNPKPLDVSAFNTLVKTAAEVIRRHEQQLHAQLNRNLSVTWDGRRIRVALAIVPDEDGLLPDWIIYHELLATARTFLSKVGPLSRHLHLVHDTVRLKRAGATGAQCRAAGGGDCCRSPPLLAPIPWLMLSN